jgi:protein O-GlcNAc transferase
MQTNEQALAAARQHQESGRLAEAIALFRQVVDVEPNHVDALFQLGNLSIQGGHPREAVEWLERAVRGDSSQPAIHITLGEAYRRLGDVGRAVACNQQAIRVRPEFAPAHSNLGLLHWQQGNLDGAAGSFRALVQLVPDEPRAQLMLGDVLHQQGRLDEAEACFRRAVQLTPANPDGHHRLATVLQAGGRTEEAAAAYREVLALRPHDLAALVNLATCQQRLGDAAEAESCYRRALTVDPDCGPAHGNLGALLVDLRRNDEALTHCRRAIELRPRVAEAYMNLANALQALNRPDEAIEVCRRGIDQNRKVSQLYCNLGYTLRETGQLDDALEAFRESVRLDPADPEPHSNLVYTMNYVPGVQPQAVFAEHCLWAQRHADALTRTAQPHAIDRASDRRLRIGYVSSHFRRHAVNFFVEPILASHDHARFEVFCYNGAASSAADTTTEKLKSFADHWREIGPLADVAAARCVREDKIDILVDLAGHIAGNRLGAFARKPAPVQVSYIGYQNTTGMSAMDYRLTDAWSDPPASDAFYTEQLVRLDGSFFCYLPALTPDLPSLPALSNGYVTFGSFNHFAKVTPQVLDTWATLLAHLPDSRLSLLAPASETLKLRVLDAFARRGVDAQRVDLHSRQPYERYLQAISRVDIALDPFPFNGHTTTCDCLWMGVPVVSLAGESYASRFGSSALVTLGLQELVASDVDQYVSIASALAADREKLAQLRATLRDRMKASPLLDFVGFTRKLEAAYGWMWSRWCEQELTR